MDALPSVLIVLCAVLVWVNTRTVAQLYQARSEVAALEARLKSLSGNPVFDRAIASAPEMFASGRATVVPAPPTSVLDANGNVIFAGVRVEYQGATYTVFGVVADDVVLQPDGSDVGLQCPASEVARCS